MAVNKVVFGNQTIIDLTNDDVTASDVASGKYFHLPNGQRTVGTGNASAVTSVNGYTGDVVLDADDVNAIPDTKLSSVISVTLLSANWSSNEQTISNAGFVTSGFAYMVSPSPSAIAEYAKSFIYADDVTVTGQMTFHCDSVPENNINVNIMKVGIA